MRIQSKRFPGPRGVLPLSSGYDNMAQQNNLDFGFAEQFQNEWMSKSKYFPSKIGGKPSFLVLNPILGSENLTCPICDKTMRFILQLYAPIESLDHAFHRHLFLFGCGQSEQCSNQFAVFRCQLPRCNEFYSYKSPDYEKDDPDYDPNPEKFNIKLCPVCGIQAHKTCSQCMAMRYCSRDHQVVHWKKGGHKENCQKENGSFSSRNDSSNNYGNIVFPEYEIVIEDGDTSDIVLENDNEDVTQSEMEKYEEFLKKKKPLFQNENIEPYVEEKDQQDEEQKVFDRFKKSAINGEVIRYNRDWYQSNNNGDLEKILWISNKNRLSDLEKDVPRCENCGSQRKFEFQVMPTLLNKILINKQQQIKDSLDWGILLVFSCPNSCLIKNESKDIKNYYQSEFIFHQPIS